MDRTLITIRILTFVVAVLSLLPQYFQLPQPWPQIIAYTIAVLSAALGIFFPQVARAWLARRRE